MSFSKLFYIQIFNMSFFYTFTIFLYTIIWLIAFERNVLPFSLLFITKVYFITRNIFETTNKQAKKLKFMDSGRVECWHSAQENGMQEIKVIQIHPYFTLENLFSLHNTSGMLKLDVVFLLCCNGDLYRKPTCGAMCLLVNVDMIYWNRHALLQYNHFSFYFIYHLVLHDNQDKSNWYLLILRKMLHLKMHNISSHLISQIIKFRIIARN